VGEVVVMEERERRETLNGCQIAKEALSIKNYSKKFLKFEVDDTEGK
jgi:hypothetical protein